MTNVTDIKGTPHNYASEMNDNMPRDDFSGSIASCVYIATASVFHFSEITLIKKTVRKAMRDSATFINWVASNTPLSLLSDLKDIRILEAKLHYVKYVVELSGEGFASPMLSIEVTSELRNEYPLVDDVSDVNIPLYNAKTSITNATLRETMDAIESYVQASPISGRSVCMPVGELPKDTVAVAITNDRIPSMYRHTIRFIAPVDMKAEYSIK